MKSIGKKILKTLLALIISTIITYLVFITIALNTWRTENQLSLDLTEKTILELDRDKIQELGDNIDNSTQIMKEIQAYYEENSNENSTTLRFDPLGYAVWLHMQLGIDRAFTGYLNLSITIGVAITMAYAVITSKKINNILKITLGYLGAIIIIPPIYMYSYTGRFWDIATMYYHAIPKYFYIVYTVVFVLMYIINYRVGIKMTRKLNQAIKDKTLK